MFTKISPENTRALFAQLRGTPFALTLWDGKKSSHGAGKPTFHLIIKKPEVVKAMLRAPDLGFGEAYMAGDLEVEGSLNALVAMAIENEKRYAELFKSKPMLVPLTALANRSSSIRKHKQDIAYHYDLGNDFFKLWLDEQLVYSCAYFRTPHNSLEKAQQQKLDHILKKLCLKKGQRLLDVGSGWGALIINAAKQYGVRATGITFSKEQVKWTRQRIKKEGLARLVDVAYMDYRELPTSWHNQFDRWVSIGMYEHVGKANGALFMDQLTKALKPEGVGLLHSIMIRKEGPAGGFINKYIFPGGYLPQLPEVLVLLQARGLFTLDVENLWYHYALTLDRWAANFDRHADAVRAIYGEKFVRMWRLYLVSSAESFRHGNIFISQIVFSNGASRSLPLNRVA